MNDPMKEGREMHKWVQTGWYVHADRRDSGFVRFRWVPTYKWRNRDEVHPMYSFLRTSMVSTNQWLSTTRTIFFLDISSYPRFAEEKEEEKRHGSEFKYWWSTNNARTQTKLFEDPETSRFHSGPPSDILYLTVPNLCENIHKSTYTNKVPTNQRMAQQIWFGNGNENSDKIQRRRRWRRRRRTKEYENAARETRFRGRRREIWIEDKWVHSLVVLVTCPPVCTIQIDPDLGRNDRERTTYSKPASPARLQLRLLPAAAACTSAW